MAEDNRANRIHLFGRGQHSTYEQLVFYAEWLKVMEFLLWSFHLMIMVIIWIPMHTWCCIFILLNSFHYEFLNILWLSTGKNLSFFLRHFSIMKLEFFFCIKLVLGTKIGFCSIKKMWVLRSIKFSICSIDMPRINSA